MTEACTQLVGDTDVDTSRVLASPMTTAQPADEKACARVDTQAATVGCTWGGDASAFTAYTAIHGQSHVPCAHRLPYPPQLA